MKKLETYTTASKKSERNRRLEHSTERSRLRDPRRVVVHVHDGRGVNGEDCDECQNHVQAETKSSESNQWKVTLVRR